MRKDILDHDPDVTRAVAAMRAVERHLRKHGIVHRCDTAEAWEQRLAEATVDKRDLEARHQVDCRLKQFEERLLDMFLEFGALAHVGLLETDAAGEFVHKCWGHPAATIERMQGSRAQMLAKLRAYVGA
jgi:hypothetical protein